MKEITAPVRTIHKNTIKQIGERYALELLGIAADLRSGKIKPRHFRMEDLYYSPVIEYKGSSSAFSKKGKDLYACGTPCCILGHLRFRVDDTKALDKEWGSNLRLCHLFDGNNPSDPVLGADAIENYVYNYALDPWKPRKKTIQPKE